ncbi:hypothetical protein MMC25_006300 [Agyrium rufum]|nr:hypothetical protein [Agyrium rufum]
MDGFRKLSLSSTSSSPPSTPGSSSPSFYEMAAEHPPSEGQRPPQREAPTLSTLPSEIITQILTFLPPQDLARTSATCHLFNAHASNDLLWASRVTSALPIPPRTPYPHKTWKALYASHHPFWFIPQNKLWFSDLAHTGQILLARFDPRTGSIEANRLLAEPGPHHLMRWEWNPSVCFHTFSPRVNLFCDNPVISLKPTHYPASGAARLHQEIAFYTQDNSRGGGPGEGGPNGINATIFAAKHIAPKLQDSKMLMWPDSIIPSKQRVRTLSHDQFRSQSHRPQTLSETSTGAFRVRVWMNFRAPSLGGLTIPGVRMGENLHTFATLPEACYRPTKRRPWQGIWVGDYSGHGCEFLVVLQRSDEEVRAAGDKRIETREAPSMALDMDVGGYFGTTSGMWEGKPRQGRDAGEGDEDENEEVKMNGEDIMDEEGKSERIDPLCSGRLECIKLTGDPNVPRGQFTWIAEDLGPKGLIRVANERPFEGARVVRSWGHIAARGYVDGSLPCSSQPNSCIPGRLLSARISTAWGTVSFG